MEEIVGEISDEFDDASDEITFTKVDDENFIFEGKTSLNDFFSKILEIEPSAFDLVKGDSDSLAGLILELEAISRIKINVLNSKILRLKSWPPTKEG